MTWNYRVIKHKTKTNSGIIYTSYGLHEVSYDNKNKIVGWCPKAEAVGETAKELVAILKLMLSDAEKHLNKKSKVLLESEMPK